MPSGCRFRSLPGKLERVPSIYHVSLHVYNWRVTNRSVSCHACRVRASFASWLRFDAERRVAASTARRDPGRATL